MRAVRDKESGLLSLERRHAGAHDLVDEEEIRCDDRARVEELNFHSGREEKRIIEYSDAPQYRTSRDQQISSVIGGFCYCQYRK